VKETWRKFLIGKKGLCARKQKDRFFAVHWQSPIPSEERAKFKGLEYYPPNADYRFELELHEHRDKKLLQIEGTGGNMRNFLRWGEFRFKVGDEECTLQVYKSNPREERLFIPFKDATSGKETYGAGRYLDLEPDRESTPEDGCSTSIKRIIPGVHTVKTMYVLLCHQRTGLR